ncbi:MAG: hypothetical protein IPL83_05460 [Bdellovibrionales bacterium]|nr:hypothetical protein [Bdellovibrionales bacterium]
MIVNRADRQIIDSCVSRMPPKKGLIAGISRKKYGPRPDERGPAREELFSNLSSHSESFEKKDLDFYTAAGPQACGVFVVSKASGAG